MANTLILCGGTGAHVGVAFIRLHILGYSLGYFPATPSQRNAGKEERPVEFPKLFLVDQDSGDAKDNDTAWQLARRLLQQHPAQSEWERYGGGAAGLVHETITPLPVGADQRWFLPPNDVLERRFSNSPILPVIAAERQRQIRYSLGMMGSPAMGALLFRLKDYDESGRGTNHDASFDKLLGTNGRVVVVGSGVGGTGASVAPTLAHRLAKIPGNRVMAVMVLNWFAFDEADEQESVRQLAALRNRQMRENSHSALEFYGRSLAEGIATVPIGVPEKAYVSRRYAGDVGQPVRESFVHAVAALTAWQHLMEPATPGLYAAGAVSRERLAGSTPVPGSGNSLRSLAQQATTLTVALETWKRVLETSHKGVIPEIYRVVHSHAEPQAVANALGKHAETLRSQLGWLNQTLGLNAEPANGFTLAAASRERLKAQGSRLPDLPGGAAPEVVAGRLLRWTAEWIREWAPGNSELVTQVASTVEGAFWPDQPFEDRGRAVTADHPGELSRVSDASVAVVLPSYVDPASLSTNGWPHPFAAADFFRHSIERLDKVAERQLQILWVGLLRGRLELRPLEVPDDAPGGVSLEFLLAEQRRGNFPGAAKLGLFDRDGGALWGFTSPHTVLCPLPYMDDRVANEAWQKLWASLSGAQDGQSWKTAPPPPGWLNGHELRCVRAWLEAQQRRFVGNPPGWVHAFQDVSKDPVGFFGGPPVTVFWAGARQELPLPSLTQGSARGAGFQASTAQQLPPATMNEVEFFERLPELRQVTDANGRTLFEMVDFEMPEKGLRRGFWREHLEALQQQGRLYSFQEADGEVLVLSLTRNQAVETVHLVGTLVLSREVIAVATCVPLEQRPVDGRTSDGALRWPDLPLKAEFIDLVVNEAGKSLLQMSRAGDSLKPVAALVQRRPSEGPNLLSCLWSLPLRGRADRMPVEIRLEKPGTPTSAHWMVWPRFQAPGWKAYYLYERCSDQRLFCDAIWLVGSGEAARVRHSKHPTGQEGGYPLSWATRKEGVSVGGHDGGPPIALSLRDRRSEDQRGLYLIELDRLPEIKDLVVRMAVDFGTAHSAASFDIGNGSQLVPFSSDLAVGTVGLSLHVSEDRRHVEDSEKLGGVLAAGAWMPTYRRKLTRNMLPSDLLLGYVSRDDARRRGVQGWVPGSDFNIAPFDLARSQLASVLVSDFKWSVGSSDFRGEEGALREHYLSLFLELALAEVFCNALRGAPAEPLQLTFTYPLRAQEQEVDALKESFARSLQRAGRACGVQLQFRPRGGLFDESRAAQVFEGLDGGVSLVGDLGGGTLDLFIGAYQPPGKRPIPDLADSTRLGGNLLLRAISGNPEKFLPRDASWTVGGREETESKLRAWMRTRGASRLFGENSAGRVFDSELQVYGFNLAAEAAAARQLIDRYFRLIGEYMARSLVAFLVGQWYPIFDRDHWHRLRISVQLRGNGWQLRYQLENHDQTTRELQSLVRRRVEALWSLVPENQYPLPTEENWVNPDRYRSVDPKTEPVKNVVGRDAMPYEVAAQNWQSHTLVNLEVHRQNGHREEISWVSRVPVATGGSRHIELRSVTPPVPISHELSDRQESIHELEVALTERINRQLQEQSVPVVEETELRAPVGPIVWEAMFDSREFLATRDGR